MVALSSCAFASWHFTELLMGFPRGRFNMVEQPYSPVSSVFVLGSAVSTLRCMPYLLQPLVADHEPKSTLTWCKKGRTGGVAFHGPLAFHPVRWKGMRWDDHSPITCCQAFSKVYQNHLPQCRRTKVWLAKLFFKKTDENKMQHGNVPINITTSTKSTLIKRHVVLHSSLMYSNMFVYNSPLGAVTTWKTGGLILDMYWANPWQTSTYPWHQIQNHDRSPHVSSTSPQPPDLIS